MLDLHLRDLNPSVVAAWEAAFAGTVDVTLSTGEIFEASADAIVSPANSFGYMDGGIDLVYSRFFGPELQESLQSLLQREHFGELPVGQAVILETGHASIPFLVSAPTMRVPGNIARTVNVYLAFRAALAAVLAHNERSTRPITTLLVPGLGTGVGKVPPTRAAKQMKLAHDAVLQGKLARPRNFGQILGEHEDLLS